jgi:hypothetical protein
VVAEVVVADATLGQRHLMARGTSHASSHTIGVKPQNAPKRSPREPHPLPMACTRYYKVVPRGAHSWVGCGGLLECE